MEQQPTKEQDRIHQEAKAYAKSHGRKEIGYYQINYEAGATAEAGRAKLLVSVVKEIKDRILRYEQTNGLNPFLLDLLLLTNEALSSYTGEQPETKFECGNCKTVVSGSEPPERCPKCNNHPRPWNKTGEQPESSGKSELEQLRQWKREAMEVYAPIHAYTQNHPEAKLGASMVAFVLERARKYDELQKGEQPAQQPVFTFNYEDLKKFATDFYYWWHNSKGTNTLQGFDEFMKMKYSEAGE